MYIMVFAAEYTRAKHRKATDLFILLIDFIAMISLTSVTGPLGGSDGVHHQSFGLGALFECSFAAGQAYESIR